MNTNLLIALVVAVVGPTLLSALNNRQRRQEIARAEARQDAVAVAAAKQQKEVSDQAAEAARLLVKANEMFEQRQKDVAEEASRQQGQVARQAAEVARLLALDDGPKSSRSAPGTLVTLAWQNGSRQDVLLVGVPQPGERIRLDREDLSLPALSVLDVVWMEALPGKEPHVIVFVKPCAVDKMNPAGETRSTTA